MRIQNTIEGAEQNRVAIAMSGGVDSSAAAALLVEQGYDTVGVYMKLTDIPDSEKHGKACCSLDDALDARQVCAQLGIPFYVIDYTKRFKRDVIDYFIEGYLAGVTPNPCVMCNRTIKISLLLEKVREFGCQFLATGHYAKIQKTPDTGEYQIVKPADRRRDQTYFLSGTKRDDLPFLIFPLADYEKLAARELAANLDFSTWDKPDSQEVCFVPKDYRDFLRANLNGRGREIQPGDFVDKAGNVLGRHKGISCHTIGQRRGLGISGPEPYYVVALNPILNQVVLGYEKHLLSSSMMVEGINWIFMSDPTGPFEAMVKVRYSHQGTPARIEPLAGRKARVTFLQPVRAITPGQATAFYEGDVLLGGGWITAPREAE